MIGQTISHYKILEKLGEGGMGVVYKAQDTKLDRLVALKFLPAHASKSSEDKARFVQEAKAASALNHPNILTVYDYDEFDGKSFIATELVEGISLRGIIEASKKANQPLSIALIVEHSVQIAEGLSKAHEKRIIHRDIKCDNIMVTSDGRVKIMDFGLAKLKGVENLTRAGSTVGTIAYMSPEQIQNEEVDELADIWSFGVVLFELLTGQLPFRGVHESAMMYSVINEDAMPIKKIRPDVPEEIQGIVEWCLQKDRTQRCTSMAEVSGKLKKHRAVTDGVVSRLGPTTIWRVIKRPAVFTPLIAGVLVLAYLWASFVQRNREVQWAHQQLPEIQRLAGENKWSAAFALSRRIEAIIPSDPMLARLMPMYSGIASIDSDPSDARVYWKQYSAPESEWEFVGITPLDSIRLPFWTSRLKLEKEGYRTLEGAAFNFWGGGKFKFLLDKNESIPHDMVHIPAGSYPLNIPGLQHLPAVDVADYFIDKFEVTNKSFKEFVQAGGYQSRRYWKFPFLKNGKNISWDQAMAEFRDATGRLGPANWEVGSYREGEENYPVYGVSWYEAAAYAEFGGKSLPTIYHWNIAAEADAGADIIPLSNFANEGPAPVGSYHGIGPFGTYDMAGNVREWCFNEARDQRCILGGGWNDQTYAFNDAYAQDPFDRSVTNGFRCVKYSEAETTLASLNRPIEIPFRNFLTEKPVSDQVFKLFLSVYQYDRTELLATIEASDSSQQEIKQTITFKAAYGGERMTLILFLPKEGKPPYQVVIFFPGSGALYATSSATLNSGDGKFIIKSGRAFAFPIYKSTFERGDGYRADYQSETNSYKDHMIKWTQDFSRTIDYLETRKDIDTRKLAYYGVSWGGVVGGIIPAVEPRIQAVVLHVAGLEFQKTQPVADPINFLPRIKQPVLMLNGQFDHYFPVETSQIPMFKLFGTPPERKKQIIYPSGHFVPYNQLTKEALDWLDRFLGPVQ